MRDVHHRRQHIEMLAAEPRLQRIRFQVVPEIRRPGQEPCVKLRPGKREHQQYAPKTPIERKDAQHASHVEIAEVMLLVQGVVEDSRNQESRDRKEKVNTRPAPFSSRMRVNAVMKPEDRRNGQGAQAIQLGKTLVH